MSRQTHPYHEFVYQTARARAHTRRMRGLKRTAAAGLLVAILYAGSPLEEIPHSNPICQLTPSC